MIYYIYTLSEDTIENVRYIGYSKDPRHRLRVHQRESNLRVKNHKTDWIKKMIKEEKEIILNIIDSAKDDEIKKLEKYYIKKYRDDGYNLTNSTDGGDGLINPTPEVRERMSKNNPRLGLNKGRKLSEELKKRLSDANKGKTVSEETRRKLSIANAGKIISEEHKKILSEKMKGNKNSQGRILSKKNRFVGISKRKNGKWYARVRKNRSELFYFDILAAEQYNIMALEAYGNTARLNILDEEELRLARIEDEIMKNTRRK